MPVRTCSCLELKRAPTSHLGTSEGYTCLAAGVSALAGLDAALILEVAFQHVLALILMYGSPFKNGIGVPGCFCWFVCLKTFWT